MSLKALHPAVQRIKSLSPSAYHKDKKGSSYRKAQAGLFKNIRKLGGGREYLHAQAKKLGQQRRLFDKH